VELVESLGGDEPAATLADEGGGAEECGGSVESAVGWQAVSVDARGRAAHR
jgi:hypothetical protein